MLTLPSNTSSWIHRNIFLLAIYVYLCEALQIDDKGRMSTAWVIISHTIQWSWLIINALLHSSYVGKNDWDKGGGHDLVLMVFGAINLEQQCIKLRHRYSCDDLSIKKMGQIIKYCVSYMMKGNGSTTYTHQKSLATLDGEIVDPQITTKIEVRDVLKVHYVQT